MKKKKKIKMREMPEQLSWVSIQFLIAAHVLISGSWVQAPIGDYLKKKKKKTKMKLKVKGWEKISYASSNQKSWTGYTNIRQNRI